MIAAEVAAALGKATRAGSQWMAQCPLHADRTPSLALRDGEDGQLLAYCHAGCDPRQLWAELRRHGYVGGGEPLQKPPQGSRHQLSPHSSPAAGMPAKVATTWNRSAPLRDTMAERYLRARGCAILHDGDLRFLPPSERIPWPTMVAVVTDFATGVPMSLHFTAIALDGGSKAPIEKPKRLLAHHRKRGGVIRLVQDGEVTTELGIGEGIETSLAVAKALGPLRPVWSAIDAGNMAALPVVAGVERLIIYSDTDPSGTGQAAAHTLAARWHQAGREVFIAQPSAPIGGKADWNGPFAGR
jgi:hypothetical protein